jgi:hypothetical protein
MYPVNCGSAMGWSLANATTYYAGRYQIFDCSNAASSGYATQYMVAPFDMNLVYMAVRAIIAPTAGTAGNVQFFYRKNDTTNTNTGVMAWTGSGNVAFSAPTDFAAVSLSAGDTFAVGMTTPTWVTRPSFVYVSVEVGYVLR